MSLAPQAAGGKLEGSRRDSAWAILSRGISHWWRKFPLLATVAAAVWVPFYVVQFLLAVILGVPQHSRPSSDPAIVFELAAYGLMTLVLLTVALALSQAALILAVATDEALSSGELLRRATMRLGPLLLAFLLVVVAGVVVVALVIAAGYALALVADGQAGAVLLMMAVAVVAVPALVLVRFTIVPQLVVLEEATAGTALRRSWRLLGHRYWTTVVLVLVLGVVGFLGNQLLTLPAQLVTAAGAVGQLALQTLAAALGAIVLAGLVQSVFTRLYSSVADEKRQRTDQAGPDHL